MYGLRLSMLVLTHSNNLSATLQTPNICAADAQKTAKLVIDTLQKIRTDERVQNFFDLVKKEAVSLEINEPEPCLPRRKKAPCRMDDCFVYGFSTAAAASHYREILQHLITVQYILQPSIRSHQQSKIDSISQTIECM